jgi:hypothetical protein
VSDNVHILPVVTRIDTTPDRVLEAAIGKLESVVVIGFGKDGEEYFASNQTDGGDVLWKLERAKHKLMCIVDKDQGK